MYNFLIPYSSTLSHSWCSVWEKKCKNKNFQREKEIRVDFVCLYLCAIKCTVYVFLYMYSIYPLMILFYPHVGIYHFYIHVAVFALSLCSTIFLPSPHFFTTHLPPLLHPHAIAKKSNRNMAQTWGSQIAAALKTTKKAYCIVAHEGQHRNGGVYRRGTQD